jgi:ATP-dependent RNA circularization protein (DNA/RNA ligase family)
MTEYHKIQTVYLRDPATKHRTLLDGQFAVPEFEYLANMPWEWTEKIDGTNIRVIVQDGNVTFGGKTDNAHIPAPLVTKLQERFFGNETLISLGDCVLYGEGYGAKIQKGGGNYIPDGCDFILFDAKIGDWWLRRGDVYDVAEKLGIRHVPVISTGTLLEAVDYASTDRMSHAAAIERLSEGLVMRPMVDLWDRKGKRIIAKIKRKDFSS